MSFYLPYNPPLLKNLELKLPLYHVLKKMNRQIEALVLIGKLNTTQIIASYNIDDLTKINQLDVNNNASIKHNSFNNDQFNKSS